MSKAERLDHFRNNGCFVVGDSGRGMLGPVIEQDRRCPECQKADHQQVTGDWFFLADRKV